MEYLIGIGLGVAIGLFTTFLGMDRDRALYPTALIVIAAYYVLFAVMGGSTEALLAELAVGAVFVGLAVAGFKSTLWFAAAGIFGHGVFDIFHGYAIHNAGMPLWWPGFCSSIDIVIGGYLGWMLYRDRISSRPN